MKFSNAIQGFPSEVYKRSVESKLTYLEENIASGLNLIESTSNVYERQKYENYVRSQAEMLAYIVEIAI